jgi:hypothetical protein
LHLFPCCNIERRITHVQVHLIGKTGRKICIVLDFTDYMGTFWGDRFFLSHCLDFHYWKSSAFNTSTKMLLCLFLLYSRVGVLMSL